MGPHAFTRALCFGMEYPIYIRLFLHRIRVWEEDVSLCSGSHPRLSPLRDDGVLDDVFIR